MLTQEIFDALRQAARDDTLDQQLKLVFRGVELPFEHSNHFGTKDVVHIECSVWSPLPNQGGPGC